jgi:uncharacterized membrane-anchored protein YitT (DUF2179 family)
MTMLKEEIRKMNFSRKDIGYTALIILSALIYAINMNSFVESGNLYPGGFAGVSRLLSNLSSTIFHLHLSFSFFYMILNLLVTILVFRSIGHKFILYSVIWYTLTSVFTDMINFPTITHQMLLISVFGGLINGFAIGIALRSNASSGGTDFIAIWLSMRLNRPTWNYMLGFNAIILCIAGAVYGWETALYSIIFQYVSTQVVNSMHQRYHLTSLKIITDRPEEVSQAIFHTCRHGITKIRCAGGYTEKEHYLLMTTINTYQLKEVIMNVRKVDPRAFMEVNQASQIIGNYYQKPID